VIETSQDHEKCWRNRRILVRL